MNERNFVALVEKKKSIFRINDAGLASVIGISEKTFKRRIKNPEEFSVGEVNRIMKFLKFTDDERKEALL